MCAQPEGNTSTAAVRLSRRHKHVTAAAYSSLATHAGAIGRRADGESKIAPKKPTFLPSFRFIFAGIVFFSCRSANTFSLTAFSRVFPFSLAAFWFAITISPVRESRAARWCASGAHQRRAPAALCVRAREQREEKPKRSEEPRDEGERTKLCRILNGSRQQAQQTRTLCSE